MRVVSKDDIENYIGIQSEPSDWFVVTQDQIDQFAECTLDHQFIHTDPNRAKGTVFGSTIAHGFLSLSMLSHFADSFSFRLESSNFALNYGFDSVRFLNPVKVNSRIRAYATLLDCTEKSAGRYILRQNVVVEIEGERRHALSAVWIVMHIM